MTEHAYLIALIPLFAFLMVVFFLRWKEKLSAGFSIAMILVSWVMSIIVLIENLSNNGKAYEWFYKFIDLPDFVLEIGILIDPLAAVMLVVVTTIGACVQIYSVGYMHGDPRFSRFFAYLSLFLFSMLGLVLANNYFMIFIFWELVGLTSYLLIGFWFEKKSASDACKKAFITTRIGDLGFLIGLFLMAFYAGTFNYQGVFEQVGSGNIPAVIVTLIAIGVFCGAIGKSAQFPLHVWLPDAMEGPTPVSALIHAATMVAAGVYLVARSMNIFVESADASMVVAIIGIITSLIAATIALVQVDIKRILAYSTVSQLGYMIMALGLYGFDTSMGHHSPGYYAGTFHLMTHAFFKGLLFLGAGSIIHAVHSNDIHDMGGLLKKLPITAPAFMIASLSISGFPLTAGFFSKDEIIATTHGHPIFQILTLLIAFMTAFYMWRLCFLIFFGKPRDEQRFETAHESPRNMTYPLAFLAILAVVAGWVGIPALKHGFASYVYQGIEPYHPHADWWNYIISTIIGLSGIGLAYLMYIKKVISPDAIASKFKPVYKLFWNKWYFDEFYHVAVLNPILTFGRWMWSFDANIIDGAVNGTAALTMWWSDIKQWFDTWIVDGAVNGAGWIVRTWGELLKYLQTGKMQFYGLFISFSVVIAILLKLENANSKVDWTVVSIIFVLGLGLLSIMSRFSSAKAKQESEIEE